MVCSSSNPAVRAAHAEPAVTQPSGVQQPQLQQRWALYAAAAAWGQLICCLLLVLRLSIIEWAYSASLCALDAAECQGGDTAPSETSCPSVCLESSSSRACPPSLPTLAAAMHLCPLGSPGASSPPSPSPPPLPACHALPAALV